jgi:Nucleotidyl transferase AbiEii toxin, Type IV TA system
VTLGLTDEQQSALAVLAAVVDASAYLAGGVAVAARLGHRFSVDLDVFVPSGAPEKLAEKLASQSGKIRIISRAEGTLYAEVNDVPVSVIRYAYPLLKSSERLPGFALPLASLDDLLCMKLAAIAGRGARRDFWDLHALLLSLNCGLEPALGLYAEKYPVEDLGHVLKSLVYFLDAEQEPLPNKLSASHWEEVKAYFQREILAFR